MPWTTDSWSGKQEWAPRPAGKIQPGGASYKGKSSGPIAPPMDDGYGSSANSKLFVGCLPYSKTEADLEPIFSQFGPLVEVTILKDGMGSSKGAGFVTYQDETSAMTAMSYLQGHVLEGATRGMNLSIATSQGGPRSGGSNGGGRNMQMQVHRPPPPPGPPPAATLKALTNGGEVSPPGSKVFVGQLPYSRTEADLIQLFGSIGPVVEVCLLKDKKTQEKKGAAFVRYQTASHASAAANTLNGFLFSGSTRPITVSIAQSDYGLSMPPNLASLGTLAITAGGGGFPGNKRHWGGQSWGKGAMQQNVQSEPGAKLFVGQLPFSRTEEDLNQLFSSYGSVVEVLLHRDAQGQKKGGAFVRFQSAVEAQAALDLDGYLFQGSTRPITVSIAGESGGKRRRMD